MYQKKIPEVLDCGQSIAIKVLGGKWKIWILALLQSGVRRPVQLHAEMKDEVNQRVVNLLLKELEGYGVIYKVAYAEIPLRVEYYLTESGMELLPILEAMEVWGNKNRDSVLLHNKQTLKIV